MRIIFGTPFLVHSEVVAIADTHIGVEHHLRKAGFALESNAAWYAKEAVRIGRENRAGILLHLGDLKHTIGRCSAKERLEVLKFIEILQDWFSEVVVIRGNHDGGLVLPDSVKHCKSYVHKGLGFLHGHCYPEPALGGSRTIVCGHIHPCVRFRDGLGRIKTWRCWLLAEVNRKFREKFGLEKARRIVVMPSASDFVGMREVNTPALNGFLVSRELMSGKKSEVYLFDGTFLGSMEHVDAR
ncbi:MAG: metallophosphoesterase [Thermoplasmata archaeon]